MTEYLIYFNQQWVGDHSEEWFRGRAPLAMAAVEEMKEAGVYLFAGGLEEDGPIYSAASDRQRRPDHRRAVRREQGVAGRVRRRGRRRRRGRPAVGGAARRGLRVAPGGTPLRVAAVVGLTRRHQSNSPDLLVGRVRAVGRGRLATSPERRLGAADLDPVAGDRRPRIRRRGDHSDLAAVVLVHLRPLGAVVTNHTPGRPARTNRMTRLDGCPVSSTLESTNASVCAATASNRSRARAANVVLGRRCSGRAPPRHPPTSASTLVRRVPESTATSVSSDVHDAGGDEPRTERGECPEDDTGRRLQGREDALAAFPPRADVPGRCRGRR